MKEISPKYGCFPDRVMKLTDPSARPDSLLLGQRVDQTDQLRGQSHIFVDDMDRLLEIKDYISEGHNIA